MVPQGDSDRSASAKAEDPDTDAGSEAEGSMPPMDFSIFVLSLNTSALVHLGSDPDPTGELRENLPMARQTIDMLSMLEEKTRGNLNGAEERLVGQVLFDLRMRYCDKAKKSAG